MKLAIAVDHATRTASATITFDASAGESAQPVKVDWGDGAVQALASGFANPTAHVYAKDAFYKVTVQANDVRATETVRIGAPGFPAHGADWARRQQEIREDAAMIAGTKGQLG